VARRKSKRSRLNSIVNLTFILSILIGCLAGALAGYLGSAPTLAEVNFDPKLTSYVYDRNGAVLARLYKENRDPVSLDGIPMYLQQAIIAVEDPRFYSHHGIDIRGLLRALFVNIKSGSIEQGGSTYFSVDPAPCKKIWAAALQLKMVRILADFWPHGKVAADYGIFREQDGYSERANIIVDENGKVMWLKVYPSSQLPDINEVLNVLSTHTNKKLYCQ
jgi:hypothetical protein